MQLGTASTGRNLHAIPFYVPQPAGVTLTGIGIEVTTADAATPAVGRLGIYADDEGSPGRLQLDAGTVDMSSTGYKSIAISKFLRQGWYWLAFIATGTAAIRILGGLSLMINGFQDVADVSLRASFNFITANAAMTAAIVNVIGLPGRYPVQGADFGSTVPARVMVTL